MAIYCVLSSTRNESDRQGEEASAGAERCPALSCQKRTKVNSSNVRMHRAADDRTIPSVQRTHYIMNKDVIKQLFSPSLTVTQWRSISCAQTSHSLHSICYNILSIDLTAAARTHPPSPLVQVGQKTDPAHPPSYWSVC